MAEKKLVRLHWTDPALADLEVISEYIALDNRDAAERLIERLFDALERIEHFPNIGRKVPELPDLPYRELIVAPCRILYRIEGANAFIVLITRAEQPIEEHRLWRF